MNEYLHEVSGEEITAKDFRTWAATNPRRRARWRWRSVHGYQTTGGGEARTWWRRWSSVAKRLGNTPAICRKCYIHPAVFEGYLDGSLLEGLKLRADEVLDGDTGGLTAEEVAITGYLSRRLGRGHRRPGAQGPEDALTLTVLCTDGFDGSSSRGIAVAIQGHRTDSSCVYSWIATAPSGAP